MDIKIDKNTVIVFDLDDTLYNEIDFLRSAYIEISKELEPNNWEQLYTLLFSLYRNDKDVFEFICSTYKIDKTELIQRYRNHIPNIKLFDGVLDTLLKIRDHKGKLAIITDGRAVTQRNKIKKLGLLPYLDFIVISEEIGSEKPNESNYKTVEDYFKLKTYYYIADNFKKDFITPKKIGWKTIALIDKGLNIHSHAHTHTSEEYLPELYIYSYSQINIC